MADHSMEELIRAAHIPKQWESTMEQISEPQLVQLQTSNDPNVQARCAYQLFLWDRDQEAHDALVNLDVPLAFAFRLSLAVVQGKWQEVHEQGVHFIQNWSGAQSLTDLEAYARVCHATGAVGINVMDPDAPELLLRATHGYLGLGMAPHGALLERARGLCVNQQFSEALSQYRQVYLQAQRKAQFQHARKDITLPQVSLGLEHLGLDLREGCADIEKATSALVHNLFHFVEIPPLKAPPEKTQGETEVLTDLQQYHAVALAFQTTGQAFQKLQYGLVSDARLAASHTLALLSEGDEVKISPSEETPYMFGLFLLGVASIIDQQPEVTVRCIQQLRAFYLKDMPWIKVLSGVLCWELYGLQWVQVPNYPPAEALQDISSGLQHGTPAFVQLVEHFLQRYATSTAVVLNLHDLAPWDTRASLQQMLVICPEAAYHSGKKVPFPAKAINALMYKALGLLHVEDPNEETYRYRYRKRLRQLNQPPLTFSQVTDMIMREAGLMGTTEGLYLERFNIQKPKKRQASKKPLRNNLLT